MLRQVVCVFDSAVQAFGSPFMVPALGAALRAFSDEVNRKSDRVEDSPLYHHPEDYTLHLLAAFDDLTGEYSAPEGGRRVLARGQDVHNGGA